MNCDLELYKVITDVLNKSQDSVASHTKLIVRMQKNYKEVTKYIEFVN